MLFRKQAAINKCISISYRFAYTPAYPLLIHHAGTNKLHSLLEYLGDPAQYTWTNSDLIFWRLDSSKRSCSVKVGQYSGLILGHHRSKMQNMIAVTMISLMMATNKPSCKGQDGNGLWPSQSKRRREAVLQLLQAQFNLHLPTSL